MSPKCCGKEYAQNRILFSRSRDLRWALSADYLRPFTHTLSARMLPLLLPCFLILIQFLNAGLTSLPSIFLSLSEFGN